MVLDIIDTALDRENIDTYILMTGDRDFLRVVNRLRNRLGKRVIIVGVHGAISQDLQEAADEVLYLDPPAGRTSGSPSLIHGPSRCRSGRGRMAAAPCLTRTSSGPWCGLATGTAWPRPMACLSAIGVWRRRFSCRPEKAAR